MPFSFLTISNEGPGSCLFSNTLYKMITLYKSKEITGVRTNLNFIKYFIFVTAVPSIFVAVFSLMLFNLGIEKWFDKKVNDVVNNSVEVARNYLEENQNSIKGEILAMANDLNRNFNLYNENKPLFQNYFDQQSRFRKIEESYLINKDGLLLFSTSFTNKSNFISPLKTFLDMAQNGQTILISDANKNQTNALVKLNTPDNIFLYTIRYVDPETVNFLKKTGEASTFYYKLKSNSLGLQISFALVYIVIVSSLILLSGIYAINIANKISKPIIKLIFAAKEVSTGNLDVKLKDEKEDDDFKKLYQTFNIMTQEIQAQKNKIALSERYQAWEMVAKKLAHEIKNPLTPITLSLERIKDRYSKQINIDKADFENYLNIISRQVEDIGKLANEFSDFARMPNPIKKSNNLKKLIQDSINLYKLSENKIIFDLNYNSTKDIFEFDLNQISRVLINIIKNSLESIHEKQELDKNLQGIINIFVENNNDFIYITIEDNGVGFKTTPKDLISPLTTTKQHGSGLGLSIVSKILHQHGGDLNFIEKSNGAKIKLSIKIN
ncbi:MAG: HAMP domain-containing protein [Candidatus Fonsibacter lacus]|uniref:histidine kinase n=1 Tax=Candidatus Fonsibacter lacus TaxID=2576439 RepID=A0A966HTL6_9PROT|nr:HAMP domain-containing protein [Candidatus Fonsibacter lacus]